MKAMFKFVAQAVAGVAATTSVALASVCGLPNTPPCPVSEPGSLPLMLAGVVGAVVVARFFKKK